ncbi:MAG TPA: PKD domain-containing protein [Prolixibacteraceae bacterium]|nr:PKD domain-containing protein [Prolixibacteraceae bacterium]HRV90397.1 PKD domain-containing protein [Prolixibacteraceae bacterium]
MRKFFLAVMTALLLSSPTVAAETITSEEIIAFWKKNGITEVSLEVTQFLDFLLNDSKLADLGLFQAFDVFLDLEEFYQDLNNSPEGVSPDYYAAVMKLTTNVGMGSFFSGMAPYKSYNMASMGILFDIIQSNDALFINHQIAAYKCFVEVEGIRDPYAYDYCTLGGYLYHKSYVFAPYPLHPDELTPEKVREIVEKSYNTIYGNTRDEESDARRFAAASYDLLEEKAAILQGYMNGSFTDVVLADRLGNGLFINNAGPDTIFRLMLIEEDLLLNDDTIFIGTLPPGGETLLTADMLDDIPGRDFDQIVFVTSGFPVTLDFSAQRKPFVGSFDLKTSPSDLFPGTVPEVTSLNLLVYAQENEECFTIHIDYGDGTTESFSPCTNSGMVSLHLSHTFLRNGWFDLHITITNSSGVSAVLTDYLFLEKPLKIGYPLVPNPFLQANTPITFDDHQITTNGMEIQYAWDFDFNGSFSPDSYDRFPTTTFLPDPAKYSDTTMVEQKIALVVAAEYEGVVYTDTLIQTLNIRKPVYALFSTIPALGSRNEVYTDTGVAEVGFLSPVVPAPEQTNFSFLWDFGDGSTASGATVSHTFTAGSYPVKLTISDGLYTAVTSLDLRVFSMALPESSTLVTGLEYFFDTDPGAGNANALEVPEASGVSADLHIPLSGLSPGVHRLFLRARDENGHWSMPASRPVVVTKEERPTSVTALEYFFDQPGAPGSGSAFPLTPSGEMTLTAPIPLAELSPGVHRIFFRAENAIELNSPLVSRPLLVTMPPSPITEVEFFIDLDPGPGNAHKWPLTPGFDLSLSAGVPLAEVPFGQHQFSVRAKNSLNLWSYPVSAPFTIEMPRQQLSFNTGWNLFSSYILPENSDMQILFQPLIDSMKLIKIVDSQGRSLELAGDPGVWTNAIGPMLPDQGYKVRMAAPGTLSLPGTPATLPLDIPLSAGWNTVSFPRELEADALTVLQQLIDRGSLVKVQDEKGNAIENLGTLGGWHNAIGLFRSGEAYRICVNQPDTLTIFPTYPPSSLAQP